MAAENDTPVHLDQLLDEAQAQHEEIIKSQLEFKSEEFQRNVEKCRSCLEHLTVLVSQVGLFSNNESIEELATSSIRYLLLPGLLGDITLKRKFLVANRFAPPSSSSTRTHETTATNGTLEELPTRSTIIRLAIVYYRDFILRCKQYGVTKVELPMQRDDSEDGKNKPTPVGASRGRPTPQQLKVMGQQRDEKIRCFKEKKSLEENLKRLRQILGDAEEETRREYYCSLISYTVMVSLEELGSLAMEEQMLQQMAARCQQDPGAAAQRTAVSSSPPMRPFLITRDAAQKKVYGAGYPSLPLMSVDEFYDKKVEEGWFPPGSSSVGGGSSSVAVEYGSSSSVGGGISSTEIHEAAGEERQDDDQNSDEEDSEDKRAKLVKRDEWRDNHRRGWGNTYNRS